MIHNDELQKETFVHDTGLVETVHETICPYKENGYGIIYIAP